VEDQDQD